MTINRSTLRKKLNDEILIDKIFRKARANGTPIYDKMGRGDNGRIVVLIHFELEDFLEAQREFINRIRVDARPMNEGLLKIMEKLL